VISTRAKSSSSRGALPSELVGDGGGGVVAIVVNGGGDVIVALIFHRLSARVSSLISFSSAIGVDYF
jgi:hypothetical protein